MGYRITGFEALQNFDTTLQRLRKKVADAIDAAEELDHREADIQHEQLDHFRTLAEVRLGLIERGEADLADRAHREAKALLEQHDAYVADEAKQLAAAAKAIKALEDERTKLTKTRAEQLDAYETLVASVETKLQTDPDYIALVAASDDANSIAERAELKLAVSQEELEQKGEPYRTDPLFSYLWKRGFRTTDYKGGGLFKMLDGWVARLCKYDDARANYARLNDIPVWLGEHAADQNTKADKALATLEAAETKALADAGAVEAETAAQNTLAAIGQIDGDLVSEETRHGALAEMHAQALAKKIGPANDARKVLSDSLQTLPFPNLRRLASETLTQEDDRLVNHLVDLRKEELSLELEAEQINALPRSLKASLGNLERLRRQFKSARFDSAYAMFKPAVVEDAIRGILEGHTNPDKAFRRLQSSVRKRKPRTDPGFGGRSRNQTLGLPDVLGEVAWEILKQGSRGRSIGLPTRKPSRRPTRRRSKGPSIGSSRGGSKKRGGFRTGDGF